MSVFSVYHDMVLGNIMLTQPNAVLAFYIFTLRCADSFVGAFMDKMVTLKHRREVMHGVPINY